MESSLLSSDQFVSFSSTLPFSLLVQLLFQLPISLHPTSSPSGQPWSAVVPTCLHSRQICVMNAAAASPFAPSASSLVSPAPPLSPPLSPATCPCGTLRWRKEWESVGGGRRVVRDLLLVLVIHIKVDKQEKFVLC